jgi:hypothetical protein
MSNLGTRTISAVAFVASLAIVPCAFAQAPARAGAQTPPAAGQTGDPGQPGMMQPGMHPGAVPPGAVQPETGAASAPGAVIGVPDTQSSVGDTTNRAMNGGQSGTAAGTYDASSGSRGSWGWVGLLGLFGLLGMRNRNPVTTDHVHTEREAPSINTRL